MQHLLYEEPLGELSKATQHFAWYCASTACYAMPTRGSWSQHPRELRCEATWQYEVSACMQGEGEVKAFSALRVRLRAALHRQRPDPAHGERPTAPPERHVVVCGDSDAVVMALMLDPRADVTIDFGARNGVLRVQQLRERWVLRPLMHAGVQLGGDHQLMSGYAQVCVLTLLCAHPVARSASASAPSAALHRLEVMHSNHS